MDVVTSTALVFICLLSFKPYIISEFEFWDQLIIDSIITSIVFVVLIVKSSIVVKMIHLENWTVKMDLIAQLIVQLTIAAFIVALSPIVLNTWFKHPISIDGKYVLVIFGFVNLIGFMLYCVFVSLNYIFQVSSDSSEDQKQVEVKSGTEVIISGKNQGEKLVLLKENLICISTNGHYIDIFIVDAGKDKFKKLVFRNSILAVANSLKDHDEFIQCHRSHLINMNHIDSLLGSTKKMEIKLVSPEIKIPVSRAKSALLVKKFKIHSESTI